MSTENETHETDCNMETEDNMQESSEAISGAQSQTVQQILAYLSQGVGLNSGQSVFKEDKPVNATDAELSLPSSASANEDRMAGNHGDRLTGEELFRLIMNDHHYLKLDGNTTWPNDNNLPLVPNAADIQKFFLETINLISFQPIKDLEPGSGQTSAQEDELNSHAQEIPKSAETTNVFAETGKTTEDSQEVVKEVENGEFQQANNIILTKEERDQRRKDRQIWTSECRAVLGRVQQNTLLSHAVDLLPKLWKSYILTSPSEINEQAIQMARELQQTDDVMEMLEDQDRYVWQIIDEMAPTNLTI